MSREELDAYASHLQRERRARLEAETLLQQKADELNEAHRRLALATRGQLETLTRVGEALGQIQDLDLLMHRMLLEARRLSGSEAGSLFLRQGNEIRCMAAQNERIDPEGFDLLGRLGPHECLPVGMHSLAGTVAMTGMPLNVTDAYDLPASVPYRFDTGYDQATGYRTRAILSLPLKGQDGEVMGVLQLSNPSPSERTHERVFTEDRQALMGHFATIASGCMERARLVRSIIVRMIRSVELRDRHETAEHAGRVADISVALWQAWGESTGMPTSELERGADRLRMAAMLHDVGKVGVSDAILQKRGPLTPEEMAQVRKHTTLGVRLFDAVQSEFDRHARDVILYHHARWDGGGYPSIDELEALRREAPEAAGPVLEPRGEGIPIFARIVAIADVFDALISPRVYKRAWSVDESLRAIAAESGTHFDPRLAALLPEVIRKREARLGRAVA